MKKRLFNEQGQYTSASQSFHNMIGNAVEQILNDWYENDWDIRDMANITTEAVLERVDKLIFGDLKKRMEQEAERQIMKQQPEQSHPQQQEP